MGKSSQKINQLKSDIEQLKSMNKTMSEELEKIRSKSDLKSDEKKSRVRPLSRNIVGWTVSLEADGYYRARRKIDGKTRSVYIGKRVPKSVDLKLERKEREIREKIINGLI